MDLFLRAYIQQVDSPHAITYKVGRRVVAVIRNVYAGNTERVAFYLVEGGEWEYECVSFDEAKKAAELLAWPYAQAAKRDRAAS